MEKNYKISIKKRLIIALCVMVMIVLFVPRVYVLKDGGSKEFTALTYRNNRRILYGNGRLQQPQHRKENGKIRHVR